MTVEFWFLIGAALVFWMQAGFAMVETGFTRAKNAGNIIMKNLMDFCIGTVVFSILGYGLMMGEDTFFGLIGKPNLDLFTHFKEFIASPADGFTGASYFVFNLVFCATTATIVSGSMAERTKFSAYCVYSAVISLVIYPIEAHWIWGGGWLSQIGFHDYTGSCAIHMVGGIAALIGAAVLGPRIGKYKTDSAGKIIKVNAIPGHSLPLGALGVFILWLGWYGFNGAAATSASELSLLGNRNTHEAVFLHLGNGLSGELLCFINVYCMWLNFFFCKFFEKSSRHFMLLIKLKIHYYFLQFLYINVFIYLLVFYFRLRSCRIRFLS